MLFPPAFLTELKTRARVEEVIGRRIPLIRKGRELHACCPFHTEKSPSFTVNPQKNFYHCFGCGAHGDALKFIVEHDRLPFPEAVRQLAGESGLALPEVTPEARQHYDRLDLMRKACAATARWFAAQLATPAGQAARGYLQKRGVSPEAVRNFQLGFAPDSWEGLKTALIREGFREDLLTEAGLLIHNAERQSTYDRFRGRLIFPVLDTGGQVVAFGGRSLDGSEPKYLNSPETPLFHKGGLLYGYAQARGPASKAGQCLVVEGYLDVIALHQAGFPTAVAPLGTALGEEQLQLLWRLCDVPVICFDGDPAGQRAAGRAVERALPLLEPGHSLRFLALPTGEDPDSLIRGRGAEAFAALLPHAVPLEEQLLRQILAIHPADRPEGKAAALQAIRQAATMIKHQDVRPFVHDALKNKFYALITPQRKGGLPVLRGLPGLRPPGPLRTQGGDLARRHQMQLLQALLTYPELAQDLSEEIAAVRCGDPQLDKLREALLMAISDVAEVTPATLAHWLQEHGQGEVLALLSHGQAVLPPLESCRMQWHEFCALQTDGRGGLAVDRQAARFGAMDTDDRDTKDTVAEKRPSVLTEF
jgi:DNA primase